MSVFRVKRGNRSLANVCQPYSFAKTSPLIPPYKCYRKFTVTAPLERERQTLENMVYRTFGFSYRTHYSFAYSWIPAGVRHGQRRLSAGAFCRKWWAVPTLQMSNGRAKQYEVGNADLRYLRFYALTNGSYRECFICPHVVASLSKDSTAVVPPTVWAMSALISSALSHRSHNLK